MGNGVGPSAELLPTGATRDYAQRNIKACVACRPAMRPIRVHSRRPKSRDGFAATLSRDLNKPVQSVDSWEACVRDADIVVEASRLRKPEPLLKTDWIKRGALVVPYGTMSAVELSLTDIMNKMVVDD